MNDKFEVGKENARYLKKLLLKAYLNPIISKNISYGENMWKERTVTTLSEIINALREEENAESIIGNMKERLSLLSLIDLYNKTKNEGLKEALFDIVGMQDKLTYEESDKLSIERQLGFLIMPIFNGTLDENYNAGFKYEENGYIFDFEIISADSEIGSSKKLNEELIKIRYLDEEANIQYKDLKNIIRYIIDNAIIGKVNLHQIKQMADILYY